MRAAPVAELDLGKECMLRGGTTIQCGAAPHHVDPVCDDHTTHLRLMGAGRKRNPRARLMTCLRLVRGL
jgi:hypothetical protein